jgi:hypothetical protein
VTARGGTGLGACADAVGHCVLIFAFLPTLASLPAWLAFEAQNPLNLSDPVVLIFLPVRGAILLLHAFRAGVANGVLAGLVDGLLVWVWVRRYGLPSPAGRAPALGAVGGALAALIVVIAKLVGPALQAPLTASLLAPIAFELVAGVVCGLVAAPRAAHLAAAAPGVATTGVR